MLPACKTPRLRRAGTGATRVVRGARPTRLSRPSLATRHDVACDAASYVRATRANLRSAPSRKISQKMIALADRRTYSHRRAIARARCAVRSRRRSAMKIGGGTALAWLLRLAVALILTAVPRGAGAQSRDAEHYQLLVNRDGHIKSLAVIGGNIAVNSPGGFLNLAHHVTVTDGHAVVGDTVRIQVRSHAFDVFANTLFTGLGSLIAGTVTQPLLPPIFAPEPLVVPDPFDPFNLPPNFPIHCAGSARTGGQRETFTLLPGSYGDVSVGQLGTLILQSGDYTFCSLTAVSFGTIMVKAPATIDIADILLLATRSRLLPVGSPATIQINVMGSLVRFGERSIFDARLFAPFAKTRVGGTATIMGHLVTDRFQTDAHTMLFMCGNGVLDEGEQCDVTAPNGDRACPGICVPPGQPNECTCTPATTTTTVTSTTSTTQATTTTTTTTPTTMPEMSPTTTTTSLATTTTTLPTTTTPPTTT